MSANHMRMAEAVDKLEAARADLIHVDIIDGIFAPNISLGPAFVRDLNSQTSTPIDVHMMVVNPLKYVETFRNAGADYISVHAETLDSASSLAYLRMQRDLGFIGGIALRPSTQEPPWLRERLSELGYLVPMSVEPGFSGQKFIPSSMQRISQYAEFRRESRLNFEIEADGGVTTANAPDILQAGANILVAGAAVFDAPSVADAIRALKEVK